MADSPSSGNDECAARPVGAQPHAQHAARRGAEAVVGRLAVDQEAHAGGRLLVGHPRAVAAALLADHEQQPDARLAALARSRSAAATCAARIPFASHDAAAEEQAALLPARKERRHAVEVRGEDDLRARARACAKTLKRPSATGCSSTRVAAVARGTAPATRRPSRFAPGRRIDVDEAARQRDRRSTADSTESIARARCARRSSRRDTSR